MTSVDATVSEDDQDHVSDIGTCGNMLIKLFADMLNKAAKVRHKTVWIHPEIHNDVSKTKIFLLCTTDHDRAQRIRNVLDREGLLCSTDLGPPSDMRTPPGLWKAFKDNPLSPSTIA